MLKQGLSMRKITKAFSGVTVLDGVDFEVLPGEVHALLGENGAGKSTLMKILTGIYTSDGGEILKDNEPFVITNPSETKKKGISMIHQELSSVQQMTVAENIFLGDWPVKGKLKSVDFKTMINESQKILDKMNMNISATDRMSTLSVAQQQMVEIARAISFDSDIIIMDEPTSSLTSVEIEGMMTKVRELRSRGVSVVYISHKLEEIFALCDRVTVMRDGISVATLKVADTNADELISLMVGRDIKSMYADERIKGSNETILKAVGLNNKYLKDVSFELKKGEVLGLYGLVGAGRTELARAVFGIDNLHKGKIMIDGEEVHIRSTQDAVRLGIGLVPEDRKKNGLILIQSIKNNLTLPVTYKFIKHLYVDTKKEAEIVDKYKDALSIKMNSYDQLCASLSGGNQQKVVISKWLASEPRILILDEPTRGIDVGAKAEIYKIIINLAKSGLSIIMISSEIPEILNLSSRILVMHEGKVTGLIENAEDANSEMLLKYAIGEAQHD